ncbi:signal peptide peptidase-like 4 [Telopea speciosissima]|uniref:signal peptide peptidase-like 4 n=1 Tax=Telopea speciosissima TaxID=54955 RepID=UPI001CC709F4|nr:signal peptide peptidase-like 4 [Telopea speciosissima]
MDLQILLRAVSFAALLVFVSLPYSVYAGDIVQEDDQAPSQPGCNNNFVLVKVQTLVDGIQGSEFVGVGARFGTTMESKEKHANQTKLILADPPDCCSTLKNKLSGEVILVERGKCKFTKKANVAQAAGASAILIINYKTGNTPSFLLSCLIGFIFWRY